MHQILPISLIKLSIFTVSLIIFLTINPNPHPVNVFSVGGNRRTRRKPTTFGRVLTNSSHVRSDVRYRARSHDLSGGRTSLRRLSHQSPLIITTVPTNLSHHPRWIRSYFVQAWRRYSYCLTRCLYWPASRRRCPSILLPEKLFIYFYSVTLKLLFFIFISFI